MVAADVRRRKHAPRATPCPPPYVGGYNDGSTLFYFPNMLSDRGDPPLKDAMQIRLRQVIAKLSQWGAALLCTTQLVSAQPDAAKLVEVTARGIAVAGEPNARESALADALREAVRTGAGIDLISQTQVSNLQVDFDRIFTSSFGYVRDYQVLKTGVTFDGMFEVQIRARVSQGSPERNDRLAIRQLAHRKQLPKLALYVEENIAGLPAPSEFARTWFEQAARDLDLNLADVKDLGKKGAKMQRRDRLFGEKEKAAERGADLEFDGDFIIHVILDGKYLGTRSLYGTLPQHQFSLRCDLRIVRPDSQKVIVSIPMAGAEDLPTDAKDITTAARELVHQLLNGDARRKYAGGYSLFQKLFTGVPQRSHAT